MGRPRTHIVPTDQALAALIEWLHTHLDDAQVTYARLAQHLHSDPSWVSRQLRGDHLPPWNVVEEVAARCEASPDEARRLWDASDAERRQHFAHTTQGYPPRNLATYGGLLRALAALIDSRTRFQRELVRRDRTGTLRPSTVSAVLRRERSLSRRVLVAIVTACGLEPDAIAAWDAVWVQIGKPVREAKEEKRRKIARARLIRRDDERLFDAHR